MILPTEDGLSRTLLDRRADGQLPGSSLRNEAASYLEAVYGNARIEVMVAGKKVDIVCETREHGKVTDLYVEVKDYSGHLSRSDAAQIFADYSGIIGQGRSGRLLLVTRNGLSPSAQAFVDSQPLMFHQTIWELEDNALGLLPYVEAQARLFDEEGLRSYYIPARARLADYSEDQIRSLNEADVPLFGAVQDWLVERNAPPLAILGGYGAGKSSFAKRLLSDQAEKALADPSARRPVLIKLGNITRSAGLDSLLGSLFTSEYEVRGYSFRRFKELNAKGRLLIILDGFDEMKHAMTWTEFRNEIAELNALNEGDSRVILLGRPSAFTSDDEHMEVLRGRRRVSGGTRRLHDWPEFREYELAPFTRAERETFVTQFLEAAERERHRDADIAFDPVGIAKRASEVNALADQEDEVFGKPVHARILVELALDPGFDLQSFAAGVTRWTLYSEFFGLLARRETLKPARSPIEAESRLVFLRRVAVWLWQLRDGATSFFAADLPALELDDLPDGDTDTIDDKRREYLAGAFLERKAGDTYFFAHRSFAEFLVAEHLALNPPAGFQHELYSHLVRDGVLLFLNEAPVELRLAHWGHSLDRESGKLGINYLVFLARVAGGFDKIAASVPRTSPWSPLLQMIAAPPEAHSVRRQILADTILKAPIGTVALLITSLDRFPELLDLTKPDPVETDPLADLADIFAAALLTRVVGSVREDAPMARHTVAEKGADILRLAQAAIRIELKDDARTIIFSPSKLASAAAASLAPADPALTNASGNYEHPPTDDVRIPYFKVRDLMVRDVSTFFHQMVLKRCTLDSISVVSKVRSSR